MCPKQSNDGLRVQRRSTTPQSQVSRDYAVTAVEGGELDLTFGSQSAQCSADDSCDYNFSACQLLRLEGVWYRIKASFEADGTGQVGHSKLAPSENWC